MRGGAVLIYFSIHGNCPACRRSTIQRSGGEWCRWCVRFVEEIKASPVDNRLLRVLHMPPL